MPEEKLTYWIASMGQNKYTDSHGVWSTQSYATARKKLLWLRKHGGSDSYIIHDSCGISYDDGSVTWMERRGIANNVNPAN